MALNKYFRTLLAVLASVTLATVSVGQVNWTMRGFDTNRTGANLQETSLTPVNVNPGQFGKLFTREVDGQIYAQPLVASIWIPQKGAQNVAFVCTMHDSVYCFDADSSTAATPIWKRSFIDEAHGITTLPYQYLTGFPDIHPEVGILSTPALDRKAKLLYVLVRTLEGDPNDDAAYHQKLYALDVATGATKLGPVEVTAQVAGSGDGSVGGVIKYDARRQNQRPALVLANGKLYIASASHGDNGPYHGWILCYDAATFNRLGAFCSTPNAGLAGFWMSGHAMPVDADGNLFAVTGNGNFNPSAGNFGDSVVKINGSTLAPMDYFTPYNQADLENWDADLGSCGPVIIPGTNYVIAGSKEGKIYMMNRTKMGGFSSVSDNHIVQWWWAGNGHMHGTPVYWRGGSENNNLYVWTENDRLKGFKFASNNRFQTTPFAVSSMQAPPGMPGGFLTVSSNATDANSAIVWATLPYTGDANWNTVPGVLRAFRAGDLTEIWNSRMVPEDDYGNFAKFNPPVVVNGKVYVATFSNSLAVYGLLPPVPPSAPVSLTAEAGNKEVALSWTAGHGTASFEVRRGPAGGPFTKIATVTGDPFYIDKGVVNGTTYGYVVVAKNPFGNSDASTESDATPAATDLTNGTGIRGIYYNDVDTNNFFVTQALNTVNPTIDFDWGVGSPAPAVHEDHFSVTWFGMVSPKKTGYYSFQTITDDGTRLWLKGKRIIDNWTDHAPTSDLSEKVLLVAGNRYPIQMELYENGGGAVGRLLWSGPGIDGFSVVPATCLYTLAAPVLPTDGAIDLSGEFNADAISYASNPQDGNIGFEGQTFAAELMPDSLTIDGANPFSFRLGSKSNGQNNVVNCDGRTIRVPATRAAHVYLLACAINGTQMGDVKLNYSDGTSVTTNRGFTDWIAPSPRNHEVLATRFARRHGPAGDVVSSASLYYYSIVADSTKRLVSVTIPANDNVKLFGLTLRR